MDRLRKSEPTTIALLTGPLAAVGYTNTVLSFVIIGKKEVESGTFILLNVGL
jgi:hypothetical protein